MPLHPQLIDRLVLTLAHFVWQGCLLAMIAWLVVDGLGVRSVHKRYALTLGLLIACLVLPCVTFAIVEPGERPEPHIVATLAGTFAIGGDEPVLNVVENHDADALPIIIPGPSGEATSLPADSIAFDGGFESQWQYDTASPSTFAPPPPLTWLQRNGPWFVLAWTCGVGGLALRLILATVSATVLRWRGRPVDADWQAEIDRLARLMKLHRAPNARLSRMVRQVCVVGLYRPVILFPASWVSGVPAEVLEAVIAHELAHIRRHDVWVIHLQRLVETLLFFHPATWWISRQVSRHRELCCDADAAAALNSPVKYARALEYVALKEYSGSQTLFMATLGGRKMELLERIRTVLGAEPARPRRWRGSLAACLALAGIMTAVASLTLPGLTTSQADDESAAVEAAVEGDEDPADTTSRPDSQPAPIGLETNIVTSAEPDEVRDEFDPADTPQVIERLRSVGITFEPVFEGSERHRIGGYMGLEFSSSEEFSRITRDFHHLLDAKLLDDVIVSEEPEVSLADFKMGQWHQRRLEAELGYLPDELDVVGFHPHPHLRRFVVHDGAFEFITPQSQCTPEELAAIGAECTEQPVESSSFHYDKQVDGVWWRVHGFREKPWLIVVEDVSAAATVAVADDDESIEPSPLSPEEVAAIDRLRAAGCAFQDKDGITIGIHVPRQFSLEDAADLQLIGRHVSELRFDGHSITESQLSRERFCSLKTVRILDGSLTFISPHHRTIAILAEQIEVTINGEDAKGGRIEDVIAVIGGVSSYEEGTTEPMQFPFRNLWYGGPLKLLLADGWVTGIDVDGNSTILPDSIRIVHEHDLRVAANDPAAVDSREAGSGENEQIVMTYAVAEFLTPVPGTEGEVTQDSIDALKRLISTQVPAESWVDGEVPRIVYHTATRSLIIAQDSETHARIKQFLEDLRLLLGNGREVTEIVESSAPEQSNTLELPTISPLDEQPLVPDENRDLINKLHNQFLNRPANLPEMEYWLGRIEALDGSRLDVAREFLAAVGVPESQPQPQPATPDELALANALNEITSIEADETPLSDVMQMIVDQHGININVDEVALNEIGKTSDEPITFTIEGITLRSALNIICEPLGIGYEIDGEVLLITSRQRLEGELTVCTYSVADIVQDERSDPTPEEVMQRLRRLEEAVPLVVEPGSWSEVGGQGSMHAYPPTLSLIVRQTPAVHRQMASLLEVLRGERRTDVLMMKPGEVLWQEYPVKLISVTGHRPTVVQIAATSSSAISITGVATGRTSFVVTGELGENRQFDVVVSDNDADTAALLNVEEQIEQALDRRIDLRVRQVPLKVALDMVSEQLGVNIVVDEPGLNENGFTATEKVSLSLRNIPAKTVLELLLDQLWLDFAVQDEVVLVTNHARLQGRLEAVPYDVSDLLSDAEDSVEADLEELAALLRSTVAPESWQMVGGQGSIIVIPWKETLVVTQSPARHEAVEAVLASLRRAAQPVDQ